MSNFDWQWRVATAPIWQRPIHYVVYFLVILALSFAMVVFNNFQDRLSEAQDASYSEILGGDIRIDGGYRPFQEDEREFLRENSAAYSEQMQLRSMLESERNGTPVTRLTNLRIVDDTYPLQGELRIDPMMNNTQMRSRMGSQNGRYGVFLSKELADYFDSELGDIVKIVDQEFIYQGTVETTPDLGLINQGFLPYAIISKSALSALPLDRTNMLIRETAFAILKPNQNAKDFKTELLKNYNENGWQVTTREEFSNDQSRYLTLAKRISGFVNILVLLGFSISLYAIFKTQIIEDKGTRELLYALGATVKQSSIVYVSRLLALLILCFFLMAFIALIIGTVMHAYWPQRFEQVFVSGNAFFMAFGESFVIVAIISFFVGSIAYWQNAAHKSSLIPTFVILCGLVLLVYLGPKYSLNPAMIYSLLGFMIMIGIYWLNIKILKPLIRKYVKASGVRSFAMLQYAGRTSAQENFSALVFANLIIASVIIATILAINDSAKRLRDAPKPSHYIADLQPDQVEPFEKLLLESGARELSLYPIVRGRITSIDGDPVNQPDSWLYRGDQIFGVAPEGDRSLQIHGDVYDLAIDRKLAERSGLKIGSEMTVSVLGENLVLRVKEFRNTKLSAINIDFSLVLPSDATETLPHIFLSSVNFTDEQVPTIRKIIDQFPNVILVSTDAALVRIEGWIGELIQYMSALGAYVLMATLIALLSVGALIMRRERYDRMIFDIMGMTSKDKNRTQVFKIVLNAALATFGCLIVIWLFDRFALRDVLDMDVQVNPWEMSAIIFGFGLLCGATPSMMLIFSRSNPQKVEEYAQDYQKLELDF